MVAKKRLVGVAAILGMLFLLSSFATAIAHYVEFTVSPGNLKKAGPILIAASGLKPGQAVGVRTMLGGVLSDVSFLAKPAFEQADANGAVASVWAIRGRTFKKLMGPGKYNVELVDGDGNTLATAMITVPKPKMKKK
jgi:hypothetical protein